MSGIFNYLFRNNDEEVFFQVVHDMNDYHLEICIEMSTEIFEMEEKKDFNEQRFQELVEICRNCLQDTRKSILKDYKKHPAEKQEIRMKYSIAITFFESAYQEYRRSERSFRLR